jgi:two-component system response regulator YcbB
MVVDDDKAVRRILAGIIENNELGEVIGEAADGEEAERKIAAVKPDITLMDLLLPGNDGIKVIQNLKQRGVKTHFIMISQVEDQDMISKAYKSGIEFFIHKPINVIETVKVISKVQEMINLKTTFEVIKNTVISSDEKPWGEVKTSLPRDNDVGFFLADIGILGEAGSEDIKLIIENSDKVKAKMDNLQDIYCFLSEFYKTHGKGKSSNVKAIEMRIRRTISKGLCNVASLGIEDYNNEQFLRFASTLFDFSEVRREMDYLRGKSTSGGKVNVKKFLEGSILLCRE